LERERKGKFKRFEKKFFLRNEMAKLKSLMPSLKEKKRFVVFEIISKKPVSGFKEIYRAIWQKSNEYLGKLEIARAGLWLLPDKWDAKNQRGILKVNNKYVDKIKAVFALTTEMENQKVILRSIGISGILNKAEQKFMI
jgi:ribonuclease P/MRP protein subunit POP5